jgi:hypothetical protein
MKKVWVYSVIITVILFGCRHSPDDPLVEFTIKNESNYDLSNINLLGGKIDTLEKLHGTGKITVSEGIGQLSFTREPDSVKCVTVEKITVSKENSQYVILDEEQVYEESNKANVKQLDELGFSPKLEIKLEIMEEQFSVDPNNPASSFDNIIIGSSSAPKKFTIKNAGSGTLKFSNNSITASNASFSIEGPSKSEIRGNDSADFSIVFTPQKEGEVFADITVKSNGGDFTFKVTGKGVPTLPIINVFYEDEPINPGKTVIVKNPIVIKKTVPVTITIKNTGNKQLTLSDYTISDSINFSKQTSIPFGTVVPADNQPTSFIVNCHPTKEGENITTISIYSDDPDRNPFTFYIRVIGEKKWPVIVLKNDGKTIGSNSTGIPDVPFGSVSIGKPEPEVEVFTLSNSGEVALNLTGEKPIVSNNSHFVIVTQPSAIVEAGKEITFSIWYEPVNELFETATITILNDSEIPLFRFIVSGTGILDRPIIELKYDGQEIAHNTGAKVDVDFGIVNVGENSKEILFSLKNTGIVNLQFSGSPIIKSDDTHFTVTPPSVTSLLPGATTSFKVKYTPTAEEENSADIIITSNTQDGLFKFIVKGKGHVKKPQIAVIQDNGKILENHKSYDFSSTLLYSAKSVSFTVENKGDADLNFTNTANRIAFVELTDQWTIVKQPSVSEIVSPGGSAEFIVRFNPSSVADYTSDIVIKTNSKDDGEFVFTVYGSSIALGTPKNITSVKDGDEVKVTWNLVDEASGYTMYRAVNSAGPYTKVNASVISGISYSDSLTVKSGNQAYNSNGTSTWSSPEFTALYYYKVCANYSNGAEGALSDYSTVSMPATVSVYLLGAGGGGQGGAVSPDSTSYNTGGGGGGGAAVYVSFSATQNISIAVTVGEGGSGGASSVASGRAGTVGGNTTIKYNSTTFTAGGGGAGSSSGGSGGTADVPASTSAIITKGVSGSKGGGWATYSGTVLGGNPGEIDSFGGSGAGNSQGTKNGITGGGGAGGVGGGAGGVGGSGGDGKVLINYSYYELPK